MPAGDTVDQYVGRTLGPYLLQSKVGAGGMGVVYRAVHQALGQTRAIKILPPSLAYDTAFVRRFQREAKIAANLHHPNVVQIYDVREEDGFFYIVMELVDGVPLNTLVRQPGPLSNARVIALLGQLADALDFAHAQGVLHRDIKPANVLVRPGDQVTLVDFGIARAAVEGTLSLTQGVVGTAAYMAPEIWLGAPARPAIDQYALGIMAFEMLTGRVPFAAANTPAIMHAHVYTPPPSLRSVAPHLPPATEAVLGRQLAKQPHERYPDARAFVEALEQALRPPPRHQALRNAAVRDSWPAVAAVTDRPSVAPQPPATLQTLGLATAGRLSVPLMAIAGLVALVLIVAGGYVLMLALSDDGRIGTQPGQAPTRLPVTQVAAISAVPIAVVASATASATPVPPTSTANPPSATPVPPMASPVPPVVSPAPSPPANAEVANWQRDLTSARVQVDGARPARDFPKTLLLPDRAADAFRGLALRDATFFPEQQGSRWASYVVRLKLDGAMFEDSGMTIEGTVGRSEFDRALSPDGAFFNVSCSPETYCQVANRARPSSPMQEVFSGLKVHGKPAVVDHIVCCNGEVWRVTWFDEAENVSYSVHWYLELGERIGADGKVGAGNRRFVDGLIAAAERMVAVKGS